MCHQRDRLIGYLYNEGNAAERAERDEVQRHLDACAECRTEIAGLRSVREDLLAWEVPDHESVWRPFAPAPVEPWWRQVPAWAMAAAASVVLVSGAAGGAVVHAFLPEPAQSLAGNAEAAQVPVKAGLTEADLTAMEQRWLTRLSKEVGAVDARVLRASNVSKSVPLTDSDGDHDALAKQVVSLRTENEKLVEVINRFLVGLDGISAAAEFKNAEFQGKLSNLQAIVAQLAQVK